MNVFIASIANSIRRHLRNITPFMMQVIGPIVMVIILASIMQGGFSTTNFISPLKAAVINQDKGQSAKDFVTFLNSGNLNKLINVISTSNISDAKQQLQEGKYDAVIEIQSDFSTLSVQGNFDGIKSYMISGDKTNYQILSSILSAWKNNSAAVQIAFQNGQSMKAITVALQSSDKLIKEMPLSSSGTLPKSIDYYSVTIAVMTLIYTGFLALGRIQNDFLTEMKNRLLISPAHLGTILTGDIIGTTIMGFMQSMVVVLFTHFVYGANWGSNWGVVLGTLFLMTLLGQMLAATLTLAMNNGNTAQSIISTLAMALSFISGAFYTSPIGGTAGRFLATYGTPNSLAQTAIFGSIYGGSSHVIFLCMAMLAALSILFLGLTVLFARKRIV